MPRCLISFGANIGNPAETISLAAAELRTRLRCSSQDFRLSRLYRTPPVGGPSGQPPFVNAVAAALTALSPWQVWQTVGAIERQFGRRRNQRWEARLLDLDILLYDDTRIWTPHLKIPHPRMSSRRFILAPANEVAHAWIDPVSQWSIGKLAQRLDHGAANLCLLGPCRQQANRILVEVARQARAKSILAPPNEALAAAAESEHYTKVHETGAGRWIAWGGDARPAARRLLQNTNLTVYLDVRAEQDCAWEDFHRTTAHQLSLGPPGCNPSLEHEASGTQLSNLNIQGARYLLATDDEDWAIHELVAALDAMDCPVEPLPE